ncbi:hypothetical protein KP509_22G007300 [Ceratopteris richardii]|uniref:BHLH domain-containing protein n=1 Tax=Ceratopteris richardii TaxID=49495 RepID=A0A8T2S549_CERRI|nr:hypothetical protein KP509_22G007300 [Ceratopteris richardii]
MDEEASWANINYKQPSNFSDPNASSMISNSSIASHLMVDGNEYVDLLSDFQRIKNPIHQHCTPENLNNIKMQAMNVQSMRDFMVMGSTNCDNVSLPADMALTADNLQQQYTAITEGRTDNDHANMDHRLSVGSLFLPNPYANSYSLMGEDAIATPSIGATCARGISNQLYSSPATDMMISVSTEQRIPHRTQLQRESHILAERQRREEMNDKFTILRSMIPKLTKKDKASIVTDTINYIKELEREVSFLQGRRKKVPRRTHNHLGIIQPYPSKGSSKGTTLLDTPSSERIKNNDEILEDHLKSREYMYNKDENDEGSYLLSISGDPFNRHQGFCGKDMRRISIGQVEIESFENQAIIKVLSQRVKVTSRHKQDP